MEEEAVYRQTVSFLFVQIFKYKHTYLYKEMNIHEIEVGYSVEVRRGGA